MKKLIIAIAILIVAIPALYFIGFQMLSLYNSFYNNYMDETKKEATVYAKEMAKEEGDKILECYTGPSPIPNSYWGEHYRLTSSLVDKYTNQYLDKYRTYNASKAYVATLGILLGILFILAFFSLAIISFIIDIERVGETIKALFGIGVLAGGSYIAYKATKKAASGISNALPDNAKTALAVGAATAVVVKAVKNKK